MKLLLQQMLQLPIVPFEYQTTKRSHWTQLANKENNSESSDTHFRNVNFELKKLQQN